MSGSSNYLLDTNIVLQLLNGDKVLAGIIDHRSPCISFITEMELLSFNKLSAHEEIMIKTFLSECFIVEMNYSIKQMAIKIRKGHKLKLPDNIIAATSEHLNIPLLTTDIEFNKLKSLQILQYRK